MFYMLIVGSFNLHILRSFLLSIQSRNRFNHRTKSSY